jgi:NAD dependent epimerase/dehydratase family enzyme
MTVPEAPLRLVLGELADLLFRGQAVYPAAAEAAGFEFRYQTLEHALSELFR